MERSCSECSVHGVAQSLCTFCNKWLCYQCTDLHQHPPTSASTSSPYTELLQQPRPAATTAAAAAATATTQCPDLHLRGPGSLAPKEPGSSPRALLTCHAHRQEPLELFCESCDLLCCSSCHLSGHKNHRLVHIGKALEDQQWLFESLMVQADERRSTVENTAKQIEDRLHGVKIMQRKAENQIKMAKMIMMNELNKRASLLIEQLEKISEDFQRCLEDQLQGAIEICGQLDHVQKFITWARTQHCGSPVLFSKDLISLQMQQLLESSLCSDSWVPVKIKFNWDASYWTKQMSSLGQLNVEGGNCPFPEALACTGILRPQPVTCMALPSVCHRGREPGCGYQACCQPQMCCLHAIPSQTDLPSLHKTQLEAVAYSSGYVPPTLRCSDPEGLAALQCPHPSSAGSATGSIHLSCGLAAASKSQSHSHPQRPMERLPEAHPQQGADQGTPPDSKAPQQHPRCGDGDYTTDYNWEQRQKVEASPGQTVVAESHGGRAAQEESKKETALRPEHQHKGSPAAEVRTGQQAARPPPRPRDYRGSRRSPSLEVSLTAHESGKDVQSSRRCSGSVCGRRKSRSQSIPAELSAPSLSPPGGGPAGRSSGLEAGAADQYSNVDPMKRRASDGVIQCFAREKHPAVLSRSHGRGQSILHLSPLLSYKTEPDNACGVFTDEIEYQANEGYAFARKSQDNSKWDVQTDAEIQKVPVVCLERLKILVSRLPPHGRRQSDPLPAGGVERSCASPQHRPWGDGATEGMCVGPVTRATLSLTTPPYTSRRSPSQPPAPPAISDFHSVRGNGSPKEFVLPASSSDPEYEAQLFSAPDMDSNSDPRSSSELEPDMEYDPQLESDLSQDSDPGLESSSEAEPESPAKDLTGLTEGSFRDRDMAGVSEPHVDEYERNPESDAGAALGNAEDLDGDGESCDAEAGSDVFQADSDSDIISDQPRYSQGESEPDLESDLDLTTDEPQPLRSDLEEDAPAGPAQRPLLIANPGLQAELEQENEELESEDFCAVCMIGGDLLCCDRCPKVFHLSCHIPSLLSFPTGDWVCTLCRDVMQLEAGYDYDNERTSGEPASVRGLSACDQRKCERLTLLILSNVLSAPFHEPVSPLARHYYQIIKRPMDLSVVRAKLSKSSTRRYYSPEEFVADIFLMFRNCRKFNYPDSEVAQAGRNLESFFSSKLKEVFPEKGFPTGQEDPDTDESEASRASESGFPWPERQEQCHRKRKRRHSLNSRKHHS